MAGDELQNLLKSGIQAARSGNKVAARAILDQVIKQDPDNELGWMWLASVLDSPAERQNALQKVLSINPDNERAKQALAKLQPAPTRPEAAPKPPPRPAAAPPPRMDAPRRPSPEPTAPESSLRESLASDRAIQQRRRGGLSQPVYILVALVAFGLIGLGLFLLYQEMNKENVEATVVAQPPTLPATLTPEPPVVRTQVVAPGSVQNPALGATWTPLPSPTALPTATATPPLPDVGDYELIFSGAENPTVLRRLYRVRGSGTDLLPIDVVIEPEDLFGAEPPQSDPDSTAEPEPPAFGQVELLDPVYSPDGSQIAFAAQVGENVQELFVVGAEGGIARRLTTLEGEIISGASWSPDGERIAFASNADGDFDVYTVILGGGNVGNITDNTFNDQDPVFDPTGARLLIASDRATPGELEIFSLPLGEGEEEQYTDATGVSFAPAFSPDGQKIAFITSRGGDNDLYIMNADGTNEQLLTIDDDDADDRDPAFSPDGNWIALSSTREESRTLQIWLVRADGSAEWQPVTSALGESRGATWKPLTQ